MLKFQSSFFRHDAVLPAALLLGLTYAAIAQNGSPKSYCYSHDATITSELKGDVIVGYANAGDFQQRKHALPSKVRLAKGGVVLNAAVADGSALDISGGSVLVDVRAAGSSRISMSAGSVGGTLQVADHSSLTFSGGNTTSLIAADDSASAVSGGSIGLLFTRGGKVSVDGGRIDNLVLNGGSAAIKGGRIKGPVKVNYIASLTVYGKGLRRIPAGKASDGSLVYKLAGSLSDGSSVRGVTLVVMKGSEAKVSLINTPDAR